MELNIPMGISPELMRIGQDAFNNQQKVIQAAEIANANTAPQMCLLLRDMIENFEEILPESDDIGIQTVSFGGVATIRVEQIGSKGHSLIWFQGRDINNKPMVLVQHITQTNFLLTVLPREAPEEPRRQIGFVIED